LPILIPLFIALAITRLSLAARSSRARIKQLEQEARTAGQEKLADILAELELEVEEAVVVDLIDNPVPSSTLYQSSKEPTNRAHPILTPNHKKIVNWLNLIPIKKEIAYFPGVRNAHAMIVCRDVKQFEFHRRGEVVLRHWANSFIL
jgi:sulfur carrier protein ThiS